MITKINVPRNYFVIISARMVVWQLVMPNIARQTSVNAMGSREGNPPKKPPTQIKIVCTNSLRKLFCLFSACFTGKEGTVCTNCSENNFRFPLGEHAKWRCDNPPSKGVSQRYLRDTLWKQGKWVQYAPLQYYLERVLRDMGGYLALGR